MTMLLEIRPEVKAELSRQAAAHGIDVDAYAASLLGEAARSSAVMTRDPAGLPQSLQDIFEAVRGLADDVDFSRKPSAGRPVDLT
jgi:hypothetical protein